MKRSISFVTIIAASFALAACSNNSVSAASRVEAGVKATQMSPAFVQKYEAYAGATAPAKRQALALEMVQVSQTGKDLLTAAQEAFSAHGRIGFYENVQPTVGARALQVTATVEELSELVNQFFNSTYGHKEGLAILTRAYSMAESNPATPANAWFAIFRAGQSQIEYEQLASKARAKGKIAKSRQMSGGQ